MTPAIPLLLIALAGASGCGGGGKEGNGGPPPGPVNGEPAGGRILLDNTTPYAIEVAYLNEVDPADARVIRTEVAPGERSDVGMEELPGGWTVVLDLVIVLGDPEGNRVRRKANVTVDGDVVVRVELKDPADPFSVRTVLASSWLLQYRHGSPGLPQGDRFVFPAGGHAPNHGPGPRCDLPNQGAPG